MTITSGVDVPIKQLMQITGCSRGKIDALVHSGKIRRVGNCINSKDAEKIIKEKEIYISLPDLAQSQSNERFNGRVAKDRDKMLDYLEEADFFGAKAIPANKLLVGDMKERLYFFRKGKLKTFSSACGYILDNYDMFRFPTYPSTNPIDEPIFALASSILGYPPAISYKHLFCYYPLCDSIKADISRGRLSYRYPYKMRDTLGRYFLHWSTVETRGEMYAEEVRKLEAMVESGFKPPRRWEYRNRLTDCVRVTETVVFRFMYYHIPKGLRERLCALFKYFR